MTLQQKLERVGAALVGGLASSECGVYHYWRPMMQAPFCVWAEDGEASQLGADNLKAEQAVYGYIDYFTKTEYDANIDAIQAALQELAGQIAFYWRLDSVQYEDETNLIHYQWEWRVL